MFNKKRQKQIDEQQLFSQLKGNINDLNQKINELKGKIDEAHKGIDELPSDSQVKTLSETLTIVKHKIENLKLEEVLQSIKSYEALECAERECKCNSCIQRFICICFLFFITVLLAYCICLLKKSNCGANQKDCQTKCLKIETERDCRISEEWIVQKSYRFNGHLHDGTNYSTNASKSNPTIGQGEKTNTSERAQVSQGTPSCEK